MTRPREITDAELARLLSGRNALSVLEREQLCERIVEHVSPRQSSWFHHFPKLGVGGLSVAAAAAVGLLALRAVLEVPAAEEAVSTRAGRAELPSAASAASQLPADNYTARGAALTPTLDLVCIGPSGTGRCATGKKLAFSVRGSAEWKHFAAFAQTADGTIYWYFPSVTGVGIELGAESATLLDRAVVLGDEAGGAVTVYGVFSKAPLTRDGIKRAMGADLRGDGTISIVKRQLYIEEGG